MWIIMLTVVRTEEADAEEEDAGVGRRGRARRQPTRKGRRSADVSDRLADTDRQTQHEGETPPRARDEKMHV